MLAANDILEIIGAYVELKPSGTARSVGLCPFHREKTPSFHVSGERQFFHCFGCGKSGDAISFLREFEGLPFAEALERLAERGGVQLPASSAADSQEEEGRRSVQKVNEWAAAWFRRTLEDPLKGGIGRAELKRRGLKPETVRRFGLGYAPDSWDALVEALREAGHKDRHIEGSGLARSKERGGLYAFFRNRLMAPIRDASGRIVAFGGRALDENGQSAKYINTPENVLYKKSRVLYGLFEAREAMRRERSALLVEGYFDLMRCFDAGIENVCAPCGTALTPEQAKMLTRYADETVVVFDGDAAGVRAALRSIAVLTSAGLRVRALLLPEGKDPDDYIADEGAEAFQTRIVDASDFASFYVEMSRDRLRNIEGRTDVARELFTILRSMKDGLRQQEYLKLLARELELDEYAVRREYERDGSESAVRTARAVEPKPSKPAFSRDDCDFVAALLAHEDLRRQSAEALDGMSIQGPLAQVIGAIHQHPQTASTVLEDEDARRLYGQAVNQEPPSRERAADILERELKHFRRQHLKVQRELTLQQLRDAERRHDDEGAVKLLLKKVSIEKEIQALGST